MFLDLTQSPEFMRALEEAVAAAGSKIAREQAARGEDPEHTWLTTKEAAAFLRMAISSFREFKRRSAVKDKLVVSHALGNTEPRYQLAALRRLMLTDSVGLSDPLPGMAEHASTKLNGKRRAVSLRPIPRS